MRIAMFSWETLHSIAIGGVAAHVTELAEALSRCGHDVHVFTRRGRNQGDYELVDGVHYHRCDYATNDNFLAEINSMCNAFASRMGEIAASVGGFDVAHGHDWLTVKALVQARNEHGYACVLTIHSTEYGRCGNHLCDGKSRMIRDLEWEGAYVSDQVITVSKTLRAEVVRLYDLDDSKVNAIYNGVKAHRFHQSLDVAAARARLSIGPIDPVVFFCGRLAWQKAPDLLVEAIPAVLHQHPSAKFVLAGDGHMRGALEARVGQLGVHQATRFLGYRNGDELVHLFQLADMVCMPSRNEPFGIVILEAWSAGKPVTATRNGGPAEFVQHRVNGLTIYDQTDSIIWGILEMFSDFERARDMGRNGKILAESEFTWDRIAKQTEKIYFNATGCHPALASIDGGGWTTEPAQLVS